ncbi:type II toxin-antitoxin system VapC family toxin [Candidatus Micrarchaeota archaeon]|nr:type II toxin-antitoxin system VapC family toxin [Candidatus Micrarchaeota archaeon]
MVVLDSTFIIHFFKNKRSAIEKAKAFPEPVCTTRLNVFEILKGIYSAEEPQTGKELTTFNSFLQSIRILELDVKSANEAAKICAALNKQGKTMQDSDVLIAAIALANDESTIVTQNVRDFAKIPGIKVEGY